MKKVASAISVYCYLFELISSKKISQEKINKANKMIDECNVRIERGDDKLLFDRLKTIDREEDLKIWGMVFIEAEKNVAKMDQNDEMDLYKGIMKKKNYIMESMNHYLSEGGYYSRRKNYFNLITHYVYYYHLVEEIEI